MASNATSSASCGVCSKLCNDPRMLACLHSFCKECVEKKLEESPIKPSLKCPTCDETWSMQNQSIDSLPKDHRMMYEAEVAEYESLMKGDSSVPCDHCVKGNASEFCCNCCEFLCEKCADHHRSWRKTHDHELVSCAKESSKENILKKISHKPLNCSIHASETLDYYCNTCSDVLCFRCAMIKHKEHACEELESVREKEKEGLVSCLSKTEAAQGKLKNSISQVEKVIQQVQANHKQADQKIEEAFAQLQRQLMARKDTLLAKSADIALGKETALTLQCEDLKRMESSISEVSNKLTSVTEDYTTVEMLAAKQPVSNRAQQLLDKFNKCSLTPCKLDKISTSLVSSQLKSDIDRFGAVSGGCLPEKSTINMTKLTAAVGKKCELVLISKDVEGKSYPYGGEPVKAILTPMSLNAAPVAANVVDKGDGTYAIDISPCSSGEHKLTVTISDQHVEESPLVVYVRQPRNYASLSSASCTFSLSSSAGDVAVGDNGHVYVAVYGYHCISVFDQNGSNVRTIGLPNGSYGTGDGQFYSPFGIAVKGDIMYIADQSNHRIQKLTTSGKFITKFGMNGSGNGQLYNPRGIALDKTGRVFVSEYNNARVSVFSGDGIFSHHIRGDNSNNSALSSPWGLAFDNDGNLHVANYGLHSIKVFTPDGRFITQYGSGIIQYPSGIAIDDDGYTFIGEHNRNRVMILNAQHQQIRTLQNFNHVSGVCVDRDGFVFVCDHNNSRVLKH